MQYFLFKVIDILIFGLIYLKLSKKWQALGKDKLIINSLMYFYLVAVLYVTLMPIATSLPFIFSHSYKPMNLEPFIDYINDYGDTVRQIVLNIIMMIPFGFLLPLIKKRNLFEVVTITFLVSLGIELLQPLLSIYRFADITDLITNTFGGLIGYLLYLIFKKVINKYLVIIKSE